VKLRLRKAIETAVVAPIGETNSQIIMNTAKGIFQNADKRDVSKIINFGGGNNPTGFH